MPNMTECKISQEKEYRVVMWTTVESSQMYAEASNTLSLRHESTENIHSKNRRVGFT